MGPTEFRLLSTFMEKPGRVFSREQLLDRPPRGRGRLFVRWWLHIGRLSHGAHGVAEAVSGCHDPLRTVGYGLGLELGAY